MSTNNKVFQPKNEDIPMENLADEIVTMILSENFMRRDVLMPRVTAILKAYIRKTKNAPLHSKRLDPQKVNKYALTIHKKDTELAYWKQEIRKLQNEEQMQAHYSGIKQFLIDSGINY